MNAYGTAVSHLFLLFFLDSVHPFSTHWCATCPSRHLGHFSKNEGSADQPLVPANDGRKGTTEPNNLYDELGLNKKASSRQITTAFRQLALRWHPDRNRGPQEAVAAAKFLRLLEAYSVLSDPVQRKMYDSSGTSRITRRWGKRSKDSDVDDGDRRELLDFFTRIFGPGKRRVALEGKMDAGPTDVDSAPLLLEGSRDEDDQASTGDDYSSSIFEEQLSTILMGPESEEWSSTVPAPSPGSLESSDLDLESFLATVGADSVLAQDSKLGTVDSHELVEVDDEGEPFFERFVFVDEAACIGCTNCACIAASTFFMEDDYGRARVFQQQGDASAVVREAIETCPVDCIHYVPYSELKSLELQRRGLVYDNTALQYANPLKSPQLDISGNRGMRCGNCPGNGCARCPMYGVGENPEYRRRRAEKQQKREARRRVDYREDGPPTKADL